MRLFRLFFPVVIFIGSSFNLFSQFHSNENFKVYYPQCDSAKAICLIIHGLNNKPESMQWVITQLVEQGAIVVNIELYGHGNNQPEVADSASAKKKRNNLRDVSWKQWIKDAGPAITFIDSLNNGKKLPTYFVGYSLGSLVGVSIPGHYDFEFDGYLLFAPAIRLRNISKMFIRLISPFPNLIIKSRGPGIYRQHNGIAVAAYKAVLEGVKQLKKENPNLNDCVIIVDKKDPAVSAKKLVKFAHKTEATILLIERNKKDCEYCGIHHLIIDEKSLGPATEIVQIEIEALID